jgi:hypothetical protein
MVTSLGEDTNQRNYIATQPKIPTGDGSFQGGFGSARSPRVDISSALQF